LGGAGVELRSEKEQHDNIARLSLKMTELYKEFRESTENSDQWQKLKDEIAKVVFFLPYFSHF